MLVVVTWNRYVSDTTRFGVALTVPAEPAPTPFTARTSKVYSLSLVRLPTVWVRAPSPPSTSVQPVPDGTDEPCA